MRLLWNIMTAFHYTNAALAVELTKQMHVQYLIRDLSTKAAPNQHPQVRRETFFKRPLMLSLAYITSDRHSTYVASVRDSRFPTLAYRPHHFSNPACPNPTEHSEANCPRLLCLQVMELNMYEDEAAWFGISKSVCSSAGRQSSACCASCASCGGMQKVDVENPNPYH
ncbi:hypothetical protein DER46DRAFT_571242 [Fusarium sp. MPI-SDFR-AT-0072]|nr:hypothetical protein DER46DRAFT_571242 [Fusarium sp. MPI-SDFR-AT-0072]